MLAQVGFKPLWPVMVLVPWFFMTLLFLLRSALKSPIPATPGRASAEPSRVAALELPVSSAPPPSAGARPVWWLRVLARIPLPVLYGAAHLFAWMAHRLVPYRRRLVRSSLAQAFPDLSEDDLRAVRRRYYLGLAQVFVETLKAVSFEPNEIRRRVRIVNLEKVQTLLARGQSVLFIAAHQCNWEWMLLALSLELGYPVDAAYKPLATSWVESEMKKLRSRFGSRLVPAKDLLPDILKRDGVIRALAMVADQEPTTAERTYWTRFLNRDTAFYMGPEEIARITRFPAFFIATRRVARGYYEMEFLPLPPARQSQPRGPLTERYARLVEQQIHASPPDWLWSHKRWKLKRPLYASD